MAHQDFEFCEVSKADDSFVPSLATVLTHLVSLSPSERGQVTRFHAVKAPDISIREYLDRIRKYFGCSNECFVLSLVYIDRIVKLHAEFSVSILNIHRLLITSVMLAAKFFDDVYYSNAFYARVGGVRTKEINSLEWQFLALVNYRLFVAPREYDQYRKNVLAAVNAGIQRPLPACTPVDERSQEESQTSSSSTTETCRYGDPLTTVPTPAPPQRLAEGGPVVMPSSPQRSRSSSLSTDQCSPLSRTPERQQTSRLPTEGCMRQHAVLEHSGCGSGRDEHQQQQHASATLSKLEQHVHEHQPPPLPLPSDYHQTPHFDQGKLSFMTQRNAAGHHLICSDQTGCCNNDELHHMILQRRRRSGMNNSSIGTNAYLTAPPPPPPPPPSGTGTSRIPMFLIAASSDPFLPGHPLQHAGPTAATATTTAAFPSSQWIYCREASRRHVRWQDTVLDRTISVPVPVAQHALYTGHRGQGVRSNIRDSAGSMQIDYYNAVERVTPTKQTF